MDSLQETYIEEAQDLFENLEKALLEMERTPEKPELIEETFRVMHTLKGNSNMFGYEKITELVHDLETIYDLVRGGKMKITGEILDQTFYTLDHLRKSIHDPALEDEDNRRTQEELVVKINSLLTGNENQNNDEVIIEGKNVTEGIRTYHINCLPDEDIMANGTNLLYLLEELHSLGECMAIPHFFDMPGLDEFNSEKCYSSWDIFLATNTDLNNIHDVFVFVEEDVKLTIELLSDSDLLSNKEFRDKISQGRFGDKNMDIDPLNQFINSLRKVQPSKEVDLSPGEVDPVIQSPIKGSAVKQKAVSSIRVSSDKLDGLMNIVSEMVTTQASLSLHSENYFNQELETIAENVEKLTRQLRDIAFGITLIPINNLFGRFQRMVRDISHEMGKDVRLVTLGGETELDKSIIENLADPLMHILRNSLDHGIEDPKTRVEFGKPERGTIQLKAFYSGANVHLEIKDDGAGLDLEKLRQKAIRMELVSPEAVLEDREILDLVFLPGFSTAAEITDVSGRGVGMDVVRRNISDIRGDVEIESKMNEGTTITIILPLTLSIIDGLLVKIDDTPLILPLSVVEKIHPVKAEEVLTAFNNVITLDGIQIPFLDLRDEFDVLGNYPEDVQIVIVSYEDKRMGLAIDEVVGEYQAVLKPVGYHYRSIEIVSGATILGDGTVALVLDTNRVIRNFTAKNLTEELVI